MVEVKTCLRSFGRQRHRDAAQIEAGSPARVEQILYERNKSDGGGGGRVETGSGGCDEGEISNTSRGGASTQVSPRCGWW